MNLSAARRGNGSVTVNGLIDFITASFGSIRFNILIYI